MFVDCCFKTGRLELEASCGVGVFPLDFLVGSACLKNRLSLREFPQVFEWLGVQSDTSSWYFRKVLIGLYECHA